MSSSPPPRGAKVAASFSAGRTSARMSEMLRFAADIYAWDIRFVFANTGEEDEETLRFADRCDKAFGLDLIWLEAVVDPRPRKGTGFKIVSFETASRNGEPFEAVVQKFGVANKAYPNCNRELKQRPIDAYFRSIGWSHKRRFTCIGMRVDEQDRRSSEADKKNFVYPLMDWWPMTKKEVIDSWKTEPFDLYLPEHLGNCKWCWKKSLRKHMTLAVDYPEVFEFPRRMMAQYGDRGPGNIDGQRRFFRRNMTVEDIFAESRKPFEKFVDGNHVFDPELDVGSGCGESCEIGADE